MAATASGKAITIYAKTLTGNNMAVATNTSDTIEDLREKIKSKLPEDFKIARLVFSSKELGDSSQTLEHYGIGEESIIMVIAVSAKPSHFFFALDESGSMSGNRWNSLLSSFADFITARHEEATKKGSPSKDRVSVFFHATHGRIANWRNPEGPKVRKMSPSEIFS